MYLFRKNLKRKYKTAFTLAEVLITIAIIGTVSMMVLPTLNSNVQKKVLESSVKVSVRKIMSAVETMTNLDRMGGYENTEAFVNELKKHLSIVKICTVNNLSDCWNYNTVKLGQNIDSYFDISNAVDGQSAFGLVGLDPLERQADYSSPTVSFIINDGTSVLISYNTRCRKDGREPRTCFKAAFDTNGKKQPNTLGEDVFLINSKTLGSYTNNNLQVDLSTEALHGETEAAGNLGGHGEE